MVELRTFGRIDVRDAATGAEIRSVTSQPKRLALLVYLAVARPHGLHRRDTLLLQFWADLPDARARRALNQALHVLRKAIGTDAFESRGNEAVGLRATAFECDVPAFERAIEAGRLDDALDLYEGPFLEGFHVPETRDFEDWMDRERRRLQRMARDAARSLAETATSAGEPETAIARARRAREIDPWDEDMLRLEMRLLAGLGQRAQAIRTYELYAKRMRRELGLEPSAQTRAVMDALCDGDPESVPSAGMPEPEARIPDAEASTLTATPVPDAPAGPVPATPADPTRRPGRRVGALAGIAVLAIAVLAAYAISADDGAPTTEAVSLPEDRPLRQNRVLVVPFANRTGNSSLDPLGRMAADWLTQGLARTGIVEVIPTHETVHDLRLLAAGDSAGVADPAIARRLAARASAGLVVLGSFYAQGDSALLQAQVLDTGSGEMLRGIDGVAAPIAEPLAAVAELRGRLIGAMATVLDRRLVGWSDAASQPPSYDAYLAYARGLDLFFQERHLEAARALSSAGDVDGGFTAPLLWATFAYANGRDRVRVDSLLALLDTRRDRLAPLDRAVFDYLNARLRDDWEGAYLAAKQVVDLSPGSEWSFKLAEAVLELDRPAEAVRILKGLNPDHGWTRIWNQYWTTLADAHHRLGEYRSEHDAAAEGLRRFGHQRNMRERLRFHLATALIGLGQADSALAVFDPVFVEPRPAFRMDLFLVPLVGEFVVHEQTEALHTLVPKALSWYAALPDSTRRELCTGEAEILFSAGRLEEAEAAYRSCREWASSSAREWSAVALAAVNARLGDTTAALEGLTWIDTMSTRSEPRRLTLKAMVLANLGREEQAVRLIHQALDSGRWNAWGFLHSDPFLQPLRSRPDFQALVEPKG